MTELSCDDSPCGVTSKMLKNIVGSFTVGLMGCNDAAGDSSVDLAVKNDLAYKLCNRKFHKMTVLFLAPVM